MKRLAVLMIIAWLLRAQTTGPPDALLLLSRWLGPQGRATALAEIAAGHDWVGFVTSDGPGAASTPFTTYLSPTPMVLPVIVPTTTGGVQIAVAEKSN